MLKPIGESLGHWSPDQGSRWTSDPLSLLSAAWSEIVGDDVARNTHPARILDGALWVTTRSSAWSQQLTFLADRILEAVRARIPQTPVERLRFRVGKLPVRARIARRQRPASPPSITGEARTAVSPAADAVEALQRFRTSVETLRRAKLQAGWKECTGCGAPVGPAEGLCGTCRNEASQQREAATARLLFEAPWLSYGAAAELIDGLTPEDYEAIRIRLLSRWWEMLVRARAAKRLSRDGRERTIASSYVVLKSKLSPEAIDPATVRNVLGDELNDLLYGTER